MSITFAPAVVAHLIGKQLNWAVTMLDGKYSHERAWDRVRTHKLSPSTNWSQGGPIMQRLGIGISEPRDDGTVEAHRDFAHATGPTPLIAAMRCAVMSEFGETMDVPVVVQGRHRVAIDMEEVERLHTEAGLTYRKIAANLGVCEVTLRTRRAEGKS